MSDSVSSVFMLLVLGMPFLLFIMFLPTFLELKKPKDAGPRLIMPEFLALILFHAKMAPILDIEAHYELDLKLLPLVAHALNVLPCLDN